MSYPILTERLSIKPLAMVDLDTFVTYRQDPDIARFQGWETSYSKNQAIDLIESQAGSVLPIKGEWLQMAIYNLVSQEHMGDLAIKSVEDEDSTFELGFTIAKPHQGQGFAKEAASKLMRYLVSEAGAKKFIATTESRNSASIKVLAALGFQKNDSKSWTELFKNEVVTIDYFEISLSLENRQAVG
jgi:RimJ/RimL family protein N-acetyltransferase